MIISASGPLPSRPGPITQILATALAIFLLAAPSQGQSTHELREENERLKAQVSDLQKDLDAARQRLQELESQVQELRARQAAPVPTPSAARPQPPVTPPPRVTIDESVPTASPRALFDAVTRKYHEAMSGLTLGREGRPERDIYLRHLEKWAGGARRELGGPVQWTVRIIDPDRDLPAGREIEVVAVDPVTGAPLGDTFMIALEPAQIERLWRIYDRRIEDRETLGPLELRAIVEPIITINPGRETRGTFDNPIFIGPFAEYSFRVNAKSLMPREEKPAPTSPGNPVKPPAPAPPASK